MEQKGNEDYVCFQSNFRQELPPRLFFMIVFIVFAGKEPSKLCCGSSLSNELCKYAERLDSPPVLFLILPILCGSPLRRCRREEGWTGSFLVPCFACVKPGEEDERQTQGCINRDNEAKTKQKSYARITIVEADSSPRAPLA